jgi:hypothetical protein
MELLQQRQQEPRRVAGAVEEDDRRPRALLQEMDPVAGVYLDMAAADRRPGQQAFVHLADLGGMGLPGAGLRPAAHRRLLWSLRLGWTLGAGGPGGFGETPQSGAGGTWGIPRSGG